MSNIRDVINELTEGLVRDRLLTQGETVYALHKRSLWCYCTKGLARKTISGVAVVKENELTGSKPFLALESGSDLLVYDGTSWSGFVNLYSGELNESDVLVRIEQDASKPDSS